MQAVITKYHRLGGLRAFQMVSGKESVCQSRSYRVRMFSPWVGKIPWRRKWQHTPVFLPVESHGLRSLAGYGPWDHKDLAATQQLTVALSLASADDSTEYQSP